MIEYFKQRWEQLQEWWSLKTLRDDDEVVLTLDWDDNTPSDVIPMSGATYKVLIQVQNKIQEMVNNPNSEFSEDHQQAFAYALVNAHQEGNLNEAYLWSLTHPEMYEFIQDEVEIDPDSIEQNMMDSDA
jgi:hypothetical protein